MLTAAGLRHYTGPAGALALFRDLGYPIAPVDVAPEEWRRGGVAIPWNGEARLQLVSRLRRFDLFLLSGNVREEAITTFLSSYRAYNLTTKSAILYCADESISIFDLANDRSLRRLDVDLARPSVHAVDRLNLLARSDEFGARDSELERFDKQRRLVTLETIQKTTIQNKKNLESPGDEFRDSLRSIASDPARTRDYLMRVSMIASLSRAEELG